MVTVSFLPLLPSLPPLFVLIQLNSLYLIELQRDVIGMVKFSKLKDRIWVRQGVLYKLSRKGYQPRMFFLFNHGLIYCSRSSASTNLQFKVHGILPLENVMTEESESKVEGKFCFTIFGGDRAIMVAAM